MSWHQHAPDPVEPEDHGEEYIEHYEVPPGSGSPSSFASRHNEFPPGHGHQGAAHDQKSGAPVHGDGTASEQTPSDWQQAGASGQDPAAADVAAHRDDDDLYDDERSPVVPEKRASGELEDDEEQRDRDR
jgi:hypothetical protein